MGLVTSPMVIGSRDARKQRRASFRIPADFMGCCQSLCLSDILPKHSSTLPTWTFSYLHAHTHIHTLDKNGSLYDPAGTESWNMQIRYETMKLTMHPTNNAGTFTRVPGGCLRWPPTPPGPRWPPALNLELERERTKEEKEREVYIYLDVTRTLDKNGSLYDPAGTESWNMQIRYETMKLTMHPTNNGSSPECSPCPESTSKRIE